MQLYSLNGLKEILNVSEHKAELYDKYNWFITCLLKRTTLNDKQKDKPDNYFANISSEELKKFPAEVTVKLCVTGQHREMLDQVLELFSLVPDYDLNVMSPGQSLSELTSKIILKISPIIQRYKPDIMLVHGDTTTTLSASLAAYYEKILLCHIEAGLRTDDKYAPWPEEVNRRITGAIANLHFSPTEEARNNLVSVKGRGGCMNAGSATTTAYESSHRKFQNALAPNEKIAREILRSTANLRRL